MSINVSSEQINTAMALALMRHLFNQGRISEKVYKKILAQYGKKCLQNERFHLNLESEILDSDEAS